ncbi:hypothetical protein QR680_013346 [Steinernema hermaphroditum]|uniref:Uncharacterized protein n=1 Tax=Steinernema hermaphroditum TaxID=289476 RepID=A0AA39I7H9_9BILA|nr:hypothetical protein QR680_013346 [Steinernema hermaphroditum]
MSSAVFAGRFFSSEATRSPSALVSSTVNASAISTWFTWKNRAYAVVPGRSYVAVLLGEVVELVGIDSVVAVLVDEVDEALGGLEMEVVERFRLLVVVEHGGELLKGDLTVLVDVGHREEAVEDLDGDLLLRGLCLVARQDAGVGRERGTLKMSPLWEAGFLLRA